MAHEIENLDRIMLFEKSAWHGLGVVIDEELTATEAGKANGMFWPVEQWGLTANSPEVERLMVKCREQLSKGDVNGARDAFEAVEQKQMALTSHVANVRVGETKEQDIRQLMGVVGADYAVCQNRELAEFTDALAQTGDVVIESCGSIRNGQRVWFLARSESFMVGGNDQVYPYILVSNGHDGGQALRVTPTSIRVVCSNTLHLVIPQDDGKRCESAAIVIRHSGRLLDKLERAKEAMRYYNTTLAKNREMFEALQDKKIGRDQAVKLFADSYAGFWEAATEDELKSKDSKVRRKAMNRFERMQEASSLFMKRYKEEKTELQLGETAWGALNAVTGYLQHDRTFVGEDVDQRWRKQLDQNLFGIGAQRNNEALNLALTL